jgi:hypothetical protein
LAVAGRVDVLVAGLRVRFQCRIHFELESQWRCVVSERERGEGNDGRSSSSKVRKNEK